MLIPRKHDVLHKAWLMRLLTAISDNYQLVSSLAFKGGTCAAMRGFIDRFSVDLDFDLIAPESEIQNVKKSLEKIFTTLDMSIKDQSAKTVQYFLKYPALPEERNTIKLDVVYPPPRANRYEQVHLIDIDRYFTCLTLETMVANKLVSVLDRYEKRKSIAARDIFDIHSYFLKGFTYREEIIEERQKKNVAEFLGELIVFIEKNITQKIINQDLNLLLPYDVFQKIRARLKQEVLMFLREELDRLKAKNE